MTASPDFAIGLAQLDFVVGDVEGNADRALAAVRAAHARVVALPELVLLGYPPDDLLLRPDLPGRIDRALDRMARDLADTGVAAIVGTPQWAGGHCFNSAVVLDGGARVATVHKRCLPNYGVFDEARYFKAAGGARLVEIDGRRIGILICEDLWEAAPAAALRRAGAEIIVCINASPYHHGKRDQRRELAGRRVAEVGLPLVYLNQVGGHDDLVFDGDSFVLDGEGREAVGLPTCETARGAVALTDTGGLRLRAGARAPAPAPDDPAPVYDALVLAIRDYSNKNGFGGVHVGLSGGIDSALVLALAVDALGPERVSAMLMPSRHTARMSIDDAAAQADALGVHRRTLSIEGPYKAILDALDGEETRQAPGLAEENIQARCRGLLLMARSNRDGWLVLATGNKSEMAVGYATLYGDMAGGFAPLKDVAKTRVYALARWRNGRSPVIPERVLARPPSAELAAGQTDSDSLPPYETLDPILEALVERDESVAAIVEAGHDEATVRQVARMLLRSEYKRRQAAPGPKVSPRAFGRERRYPITSGYAF